MMKKSKIILRFFVVFLWCGTQLAFAQSRKPNIIFINVDDLGWADLACYGNTFNETPNIDKLAAEGVRFTNAYAAASVCSPSRAAILTGKAPARTGITDWIRARFQGGTIPADKTYRPEMVGNSSTKLLTPSNPLWMELQEVTTAELLKKNGYTTCHIGKWHLGTEDWYPEKQGFDYNIGGTDLGQPPSYFDPYVDSENLGIATLPPRKKGEYLEDRLADEAVSFIKKHQDGPFFLNLWNYAVHIPIQGRPDLVKKYESKPGRGQNSPEYAALVESVDQGVGRITQALKELGLEQNTLIVFTSDNGGLEEKNEATNNDPLREGKGYPYEGGIRVPVIVKWPGKIKPASESNTPVIGHDWFPTLAAAADIEVESEGEIDGKNILPVIKGTGKLRRKALYWHFPHYRQGKIPPYSIIRRGDYKLIKWYEGGRFELYNLAKDPSESSDLSTVMPSKVKKLNRKLNSWLTSVGAKFPVKNPGYKN